MKLRSKILYEFIVMSIWGVGVSYSRGNTVAVCISFYQISYLRTESLLR